MFEHCSVKVFSLTAKYSTGHLSTLKTHKLLSSNCREEITFFNIIQDIECVHVHNNNTLLHLSLFLGSKCYFFHCLIARKCLLIPSNFTFVTRTMKNLQAFIYTKSEKWVTLLHKNVLLNHCNALLSMFFVVIRVFMLCWPSTVPHTHFNHFLFQLHLCPVSTVSCHTWILHLGSRGNVKFHLTVYCI